MNLQSCLCNFNKVIHACEIYTSLCDLLHILTFPVILYRIKHLRWIPQVLCDSVRIQQFRRIHMNYGEFWRIPVNSGELWRNGLIKMITTTHEFASCICNLNKFIRACIIYTSLCDVLHILTFPVILYRIKHLRWIPQVLRDSVWIPANSGDLTLILLCCGTFCLQIWTAKRQSATQKTLILSRLGWKPRGYFVLP
jgi:hypothetical protein